MDDYRSNVNKLIKQELVDEHIRLMKSYEMLYDDNSKLESKITQQKIKIFELQKRIKQLESIINNYEHTNILFD